MADKLSGIPRKARPLTGRGALPSTANLQKLGADDLVRTLRRFDIEPDLAALEKSADKAYDRLGEIIADGLEPDAATWEAIDAQIEKEVTYQLRTMTKAAIRNYRTARIAGTATRFIWIAVGDAGTCESCEKRHGKSKSMAQWEAQGMPGASNLICKKQCRCGLHPDPKAATEQT